MMGTKERSFAPLIYVSLEELVPKDHFYRHLERSLDLSFVYEFVKETYAGGGHPSIDSVVFFKLQLVMFFESNLPDIEPIMLGQQKHHLHPHRLTHCIQQTHQIIIVKH